jgi:DNA invertase Pin-like site-specific DNA recombinase
VALTLALVGFLEAQKGRIMKKRVTAEIEKEVRDLWLLRMPFETIAKKTGISTSQVRLIINS